METNNVTRFSSYSLGIKINSVEDIVRFSEFGNTFDICNEDEYYFDDYVIEQDENGNELEVSPSKSEKIKRAIKAFNDGETLYATIYTDGVTLVNAAPTILKSNFYIGQQVYVMDNNKIVQGRVTYISLTTGEGNKGIRTSVLAGHIAEKLYNAIQYETNLIPYDRRKNYCVFENRHEFEHYIESALNDNKLLVNLNTGRCENVKAYNTSEVFKTKEDIVKHLIAE